MIAHDAKSLKGEPSTLTDWNSIHQRLDEIEQMIREEATITPQELREIWTQRAQQLARVPPAEEKGETHRVLTFVLADELYAIDVIHVSAIRPLEHLTIVPCVPNFVVGVVNVRGRVISVIDIRKFFGIPAIQLTDTTQMVVVSTAGLEVGIVADQVLEVKLLRHADLEPPPATVTGILAEYVQGIAKDTYQNQIVPLIVLDLEMLFRDKRMTVHKEVS